MRKKFGIGLWFMLLTSSLLWGQDDELKFDHLTVNNGLSQNSVHSITKDKYGFMWFGTWEGANRFDGYSFKVFRACEDDVTALPDNRIDAIFTDAERNIWVYTADPKYLFRFNYETEHFTRYPIGKVPLSVTRLLNISRGGAIKIAQNKLYQWGIDPQGLRQTNRYTLQKIIYQVNRNDPFSLSDNVINTVYLDDCENLWVGTQNGGVNYADLGRKPFAYIGVDVAGKGLVDNIVRAVCRDKNGRLWIGSENQGITILDRSINGEKYLYYGKDRLIDPNIRSIYCDRQGFVWIGTKGGLDRFDPRTHTFRHYYAKAPGSINHPWVFSIMEDHQGTLWIGTFNGIALYDRQKDRFECLEPSLTLKSPEVRAIFEDHKHNLWIATDGGGVTKLVRNSPSGTFKPVFYQHKTGDDNSLINNRVFTVAEDADGMLWFGTNIGLSRFNPTNNSFKQFSVKTGFPDDVIMSILSDGKEYIWVSHKKGLTRINIRTFEMRNFNTQDGLQGNEFGNNTSYRDVITGEMFFGGSNGLNSFFPEKIKDNRYKPHVVLTGLKVLNQDVQVGSKVNDHVVLIKSLLCTDEIVLTWWDKTFSLEFSALHYTNPRGNKFKYKLEGFDNQWIYTDASMRVASYSNLPSGRYTFKVYAANSDGVWSDTPAMVKIKVLPPWWLSWWAKMFYISIVGSIAWFIYRYLITRIEFRNRLMMEQVKNEKNEEVIRMKIKFFTQISHEFRTPLTLIIDPLERLIAGNPGKDKVQYYYTLMHRNAKQLLSLINQLLDFRKLESGTLTLNPETTDLVLLLRSIAASFETRAQERQIQFKVEIPAVSLLMDLDSNKVTVIINNLLSNAFKFTPEEGTITLSVKMLSSEVLISVSDSGVGIPKDALNKIFDIFYQVEGGHSHKDGSGIGLALTKELVLLHGGRIIAESESGNGSRFSVYLPCEKINEVLLANENEVLNQGSTVVSIPISSDDHTGLPLLLLVDDNADIRNYIELNFNDSYRIITAGNGSDGFLQAVETIPDIVISDIMMPVTNGIELCRSLKTDERTSHIPVILLTARQSDESKAEGYEIGADAYVTKPFNSIVLRAQIRNLLEQRQRLRELFLRGSGLEMKKIAINSTDEAFLDKITKLIEENLEDTAFDTDALAEKLKMSRSQLYRKIKAMTNQTVHDFITTLRMNKAQEYLQAGELNIAEIAYKVGYSLPTNFTRSFVKQFGETPSAYLESLRR